MKGIRRSFLIVLGLALLVGPSSRSAMAQGGPPPPPPAIPNSLPGLTSQQLTAYQAGYQQFIAPVAIPNGLGPVFNGNACATCHNGPAAGGSSTTLGTRIGSNVNGTYSTLINFGGPSIQSKGIGQVPGANFVGEIIPQQATIVANRRSNPLFGLGLVDAVPVSTFQAIIAAQQEDDPTIVGRYNVVIDSRTGQQSMGKFGWKAQKATLFDFIADASKDELGVTTAGYTIPGDNHPNGQPIVFPFYPSSDGRVFSQENPPQGNTTILAFDPVPGPNSPNDSLIQSMNFFVSLTAPPPRGTINSTVQSGQTLFSQLGCASCHFPTMQTPASSFTALSGVVFNPYSDFLLHPMGSLGDGIEDGISGPQEMRTAPLWGVSHQPFWLHDGRATSIDQAIRLHAGQGAPAASRYASISQTQRSAVLAFLNSL